MAISVEIGPIELDCFDIIEVYNSSIETIPNSKFCSKASFKVQRIIKGSAFFRV